MATITIAADGTGDYTAPDASAYAALSTGTTANTVNWKPGVYRPTGGRWWGRGQTRAMTKRCTHQVSGSGLVVLDNRIYVPLTASPSVTWSSAYGAWRIELYTCAGGGTVGDFGEVWFGAETGSSASDLVMGASYRPAASLAQVNADGLTIAGMSAGNGIWCAATETSTVDGSSAQVIYVWCPLDDAQLPAVQWGGIAATAEQNGSASAGSARYGALSFARDSTASANDPSGSTVGPGFVVVGGQKSLIGSTYANDADASLPVSDIEYDSVVMRGAAVDGMYIGADQAGTVYSGWNLSGDWYFNDHRDPATYPEFTDVNNRTAVFIGERATAITVTGGTVICGNSHGSLTIAGNGASGEVRPANCVITGVTMTCLPGANDSRWAVVTDADNCSISRCVVSGYTTRAQFGGAGTVIHGNNISGWEVGTITTHWSSAAMRVRSGGESDVANVSVKFYANLVDLRSSDSTYVWAAFDLSADTTNTIPAGAFVARDNVVLVADATQACVRAVSVGGAAWSTNQTWVGGFTNATVQAYDSSSSSVIGTGGTLASLFSTGTVVAPTSDTSGNILTRGDTPIMRYALETAGATSS